VVIIHGKIAVLVFLPEKGMRFPGRLKLNCQVNGTYPHRTPEKQPFFLPEHAGQLPLSVQTAQRRKGKDGGNLTGSIGVGLGRAREE
jgi:hypothetical protein